MKLSMKERYAIMAMIDLAIHEGQGLVTLAEISKGQGISVSYLEQLFAKLRREGLVEGLRGPGGGYRLGKPMSEISIADIILAVNDRHDGHKPPSGRVHPTEEIWQVLSGQIRDFLSGITLAEIMERPRLQGLMHEHTGTFQDHPVRRHNDAA